MRKIIYYLLVIVLLSGCSERIYLFNAKISSEDINGTKKYGPKTSSTISKLIKDPVLIEPEYENIGRLISSKNVRDDIGFIDFIYRKGDYEPLDIAYIDFLDQVSIPKLLNNSSELVIEFKNDWNDCHGDCQSLVSIRSLISVNSLTNSLYLLSPWKRCKIIVPFLFPLTTFINVSIGQ